MSAALLAGVWGEWIVARDPGLGRLRTERWSVFFTLPYSYYSYCALGGTNWCIDCVLMRVMDAVKETIADVTSVSPSSEQFLQ